MSPLFNNQEDAIVSIRYISFVLKLVDEFGFMCKDFALLFLNHLIVFATISYCKSK